MSEKRKIARAASAFSGATLLSRILGFVRDMVLANFLGASGISDTFFVSFRVPNLLRELFAEGSMSSAFVPVLTEVRTKEGEVEARRLARITFTFILIVVGTICLLGIIFSPYIVRLIAPGFKNPEKLSITIMQTRIMFPFLLFVSLAAFTMGALNVKRVFFVPALASAWFNVTIILTIIVLTALFHNPLIAAAAGVTVGGFMQFATQVPSYLKQGYSFQPDFYFRHHGLKRMGRLILPVTVGLAVSQLNIFISTVLASYLKEGSITYLYYSMRLIQFPVGVFGVAMAMAVLPTLSEHASREDYKALRSDFSYALRLLFYISIPSMAGLIALREPIINLLFQRGAFDYNATKETAFSLVFYCLGIWSMVGVRVVVSTFYSMKDTTTPVKVAVVALLTNILLSLFLMHPLRHGGLALANSLSSWLNFSILFYLLRKRLGGVDGRRIFKTFIKVAGVSLLMGTSVWFVSRGELWQGSGRILLKALYLFLMIAAATFVFFALSVIFRIQEYREIRDLFKRKKKD